jgi:hypothetical protein
MLTPDIPVEELFLPVEFLAHRGSDRNPSIEKAIRSRQTVKRFQR